MQGSAAKLLMFVSSSAEAVSVLEALETGVHGVILETESSQEVCTVQGGTCYVLLVPVQAADSVCGRAQVRALMQYMSNRAAGSLQLQYSVATVVRVLAVGPGDRQALLGTVCVSAIQQLMCTLLQTLMM